VHVGQRAQRERQKSMKTRCISREQDVYSIRTGCISNLTQERGWTDRRERGKEEEGRGQESIGAEGPRKERKGLGARV
jgi:hypothetical protein